MKELSIFVDESGAFGAYDCRAPYYILTMVFHEQKNSLKVEIGKLENYLTNLGFPNHTIHSGPVIRGEDEYRSIARNIRIKILSKMVSFINSINISYGTFVELKKESANDAELTLKLTKKISTFIQKHYDVFINYDVIKIYYDNGQNKLKTILSSTFTAYLSNVKFIKAMPSKYRLFQVADTICTIKLISLKFENKNSSKSELEFFENRRTFFKNYLKPIVKKEI